MRSRVWLVGSLLVVVAGVLVTLAWLEADARAREREARLRAAALSQQRSREGDALLPRHLAGLESAEAEAELAERARHAGVLEAEPDTLVSIQGRVIDRQSGLGIEGLTLSFLSRRPRTVVVTSGPDGAFQSEPELSSGLVTVMHVPNPADARFAARWELDPAQFLLAAEGPTPERHVDLYVSAPGRVLEIAVAHSGGSPAAASAVSLCWGERERDGSFGVLGRDFERADGAGRARFSLFADPRQGWLYELQAESGGHEVSDALLLSAPIGPRPWRLDLYEGGALLVRCTTDRGEALAGVSLWLSNGDPSRAPFARGGDCDAQGECRFAPLASGCWAVRAVHPLTGESVLREIELPRGAERVLPLVMTISGLSPGLRGVVLDEQDRPLEGVALRVQNGNEAPVTIQSRAEGRFEYWGQPSAGIELSAGPGFLDDAYLPARLSLPFGTSGVVLRRAGKQELLSFPVEIVAREGGERLADAELALATEEPLHSELVWRAPRGLTQISFGRERQASWRAEAPGFRRATGELADLVERRRGGVLRIELERGFERELVLRDRVTKRTLAGVRVWREGRTIASSDEAGRVHLAGEEWPALLRLEADGYEVLDWDPRGAGAFADEVRLEARGPR